MTDQIPTEVGPKWDCGIVSPTYGNKGLVLKPASFQKQMQTQLRDQVVGSVTDSIVDRDIAFWKRISQTNWQKGKDEQVFTDGARFRDSYSIDIHTQGQIKLVPAPAQDTNSAAVIIVGRGGRIGPRTSTVAQGTALLAWTDGNFIYSQTLQNAVRTWTVVAIGAAFVAGARIADVETDGASFFCAMSNAVGIGTTPTNAPAALTQYDAAAPTYADVFYDQLRKALYAITDPGTPSAAFHKINAGGAATVIFDFVTGRLDAIEGYQGNIVVAWNSGIASTGTIQKSRMYKYDGTNTTTLVEMPDGTFVTGLTQYLGALYITAIESDPYSGTTTGALYSIIGSTLSRIGSLDAVDIMDVASGAGGENIEIGSPSIMFGAGNFLFVPIGNILWTYDIVNGGLSRSFGNTAGFNASGAISAAVVSKGRVFTLHGGNQVGGIALLNGTSTIALNPTGSEGRLTGSRMDAGIPYVKKYWYGFEVAYKTLATGDQIAMEYSIDDGVTFTACSNSPVTGTGVEKRTVFLVGQMNEHILYRITLTPANNDAGPTVVSIAAKYAVVNQNASVYTMTVDCYDQTRARNNQVLDDYAQTTLAFLDNIARQNETVTFYEPNDSTRTAHTCWVMSANRRVANTSGVYDPNRSEGEVDIVLWEAVS